VIEVGVNHEEQHQELLITDVKHVLACNPLHPVYLEAAAAAARGTTPAATWVAFAGGLTEVGYAGDEFSYDNERPRHRVHLEPFEIANRLVTCGEYLDFVRDGGYERPDLWLSDGWESKQVHGWEAPLYWQRDGAQWAAATLGGLRELQPREPVAHVSFYEADAFARWSGARLAREEEWEAAAVGLETRGNFVESGALHPRPLREPPAPRALAQMFGDVWEWTASPYVPYPGFSPFEGALGEYNGKFMCNQMVLRGGSCATPSRHIRSTYRNFFPPQARWQFSGIRLAR
jgi:ergothioneine biosynthesis protein EgtB